MYYPMLDAVGFLMMFGLLFSFTIWLTGYFLYAAFVYYRDWQRSEAAAPPAEPVPVPVRKEPGEGKMPRAA